MVWWLAVAAWAGVRLSDELDAAATDIEGLSEATCPTALEARFARWEALQPGDVDWEELRRDGLPVAQRAFELQVALHAHLRQGWPSDPCYRAIRRADLALRYLADYALEASAQDSPWLVAPEMTFADPATGLRTGDVLVTRATLLSSAGIAHMGRIDSQFSHNAVVHVGPDGQVRLVAAYMEKGLIEETFDAFLEAGVGRITVLRHDDAALAQRAGDAALERVRQGPRVPYDEDFLADEPSELFCSEVPRWAYGSLIDLPPTVPARQTRFEVAKNAKMYAQMGIEGTMTSAPADILYDPSFQIVAEWRDVGAVATMRRHDAVVESLMGWMEERGYVLDPGFRERVTASLGRLVRRTPWLGDLVADRLAPDSDLDFLVGALALDTAAHQVDAALQADLADTTGPFAYEQLRERLEALRSADHDRWTRRKRKSAFHRLVHP